MIASESPVVRYLLEKSCVQWAFFQLCMGVVRIRERAFLDYALAIAPIRTKYVQETPTDLT